MTYHIFVNVNNTTTLFNPSLPYVTTNALARKAANAHSLTE